MGAPSAAGWCWDRHCPLCHLLPVHQGSARPGMAAKGENLAYSCRSLLPILLKALGEESPFTGAWAWADVQGDEGRAG